MGSIPSFKLGGLHPSSFQMCEKYCTLSMDLGKPVEMMVYPGERHGYRGVKGNYQAKRDWEFWKKNLLGQ